MTDDAKKPRRLSEIIQSLSTGADLTIGQIVDEFGERAFGALMFIFAVPNLLPTPPGTSSVLGLPLVILTFQLMIGRQALWLPEAIRRRPVARSMIEGFVRRAVPVLSSFEFVLRPRLSLIVLSNLAERIIGIVCFALAVILFLPIPLVNILPAAAISCLALGLAERDGLAALGGYALAAATTLLLAAVSTALYAAARTFFQTLFGF